MRRAAEINQALAEYGTDQSGGPDRGFARPSTKPGDEENPNQRYTVETVGRRNQILPVPDVFKIIGHHGNARNERDPETEAAGEDDQPRPIPPHRRKRTPDWDRRLFFLHGFLQITEGHQVEQDAQRRIDRHGEQKSLPVIALAEPGHERPSGGVHEEHARFRAEHPVTGQHDPLVRVGRKRRKDGCNRCIDPRVKDAADDVSGTAINGLGRRTQVRHGERQKSGQRERETEPEEPRAALAPAAVGFIKNDPPHRRIERIG